MPHTISVGRQDEIKAQRMNCAFAVKFLYLFFVNLPPEKLQVVVQSDRQAVTTVAPN